MNKINTTNRINKINTTQNAPRPIMGYQFKEVNIDSEFLSKFENLENARKISKSQMAKLTRLLFEGKHFESPIVINELNGRFRIIDGQHRIKAIQRVMSKYKNFNIPVLMISYRGLDEDGEIAAFRKWNVGRAQSTDDFIQSIARKVPFIRWLKQDFPIPVMIYKHCEGIYVRLLAGSLLAAKKHDETGYGLKKDNFANDLMALDEKDYNTCKRFITGFIKTFGKPARGNIYYSTTPFSAIFYLWFEHKDRVNIWQLMRERFLGDAEVLQFSKFGGREAHKKMISILADKLRITSTQLLI